MSTSHPIPMSKIPSLSLLKASFQGLKGLFFDMDGTLFDTEGLHEEAFVKIGEEYKIEAPYSREVVHGLLMGKADYLVYDVVKTWKNFPKHWSVEDFVNCKNQHLLEILKTVDPKSFFPQGNLSLLHEARKNGLFLALVTSSEKIVTKELLRAAGLENFFDFELTRDDCPHHKPHPWPYLHAISKSKFLPSEIVIFEDSDVGLKAASASGCHVIKVEWF